MYARTEYEMTETDLEELLAACRPTPYILVGGSGPSSPQENANHAWAALGRKMGFDGATARPVSGKGMRFFTAVPSETAEAREEREKREKREASERRAAQLREQIATAEAELEGLLAEGGRRT